MLPEVFNMLALLFLLGMFRAWFGVVMFVGTDQGDLYFPRTLDVVDLRHHGQLSRCDDARVHSISWVALYFVSFIIPFSF